MKRRLVIFPWSDLKFPPKQQLEAASILKILCGRWCPRANVACFIFILLGQNLAKGTNFWIFSVSEIWDRRHNPREHARGVGRRRCCVLWPASSTLFSSPSERPSSSTTTYFCVLVLRHFFMMTFQQNYTPVHRSPRVVILSEHTRLSDECSLSPRV